MVVLGLENFLNQKFSKYVQGGPIKSRDRKTSYNVLIVQMSLCGRFSSAAVCVRMQVWKVGGGDSEQTP